MYAHSIGGTMNPNAPSVDLHTHSTASDGTFAPADVVRLAHAANLSGLALTDHDTVAGLPEAAAEAERLGITFLPGIEISAVPPVPEGTLHILGYGIDPASPILAEMTRTLVEARDTRNPRIVARLRDLGIDITMDEVLALARDTQQAGAERSAAPDAPAPVIGRPHIAALLVKKGAVPTMKHAFDQYLGQGGKAYVDKERLSPRDAISHIRQSGGVAVLAHPVQLRTTNDAQLERVLKDLVDLGLEGLEVLHSDHTPALVEKYAALADRYHLLKSGGSDFHGANKKDISLGLANGRRIPRVWMDAITARLTARKPPT
jgi:predicted metal-dependent phosphoesterase TrpH